MYEYQKDVQLIPDLKDKVQKRIREIQKPLVINRMFDDDMMDSLLLGLDGSVDSKHPLTQRVQQQFPPNSNQQVASQE